MSISGCLLLIDTEINLSSSFIFLENSVSFSEISKALFDIFFDILYFVLLANLYFAILFLLDLRES